jgi:hypothetical protein
MIIEKSEAILRVEDKHRLQRWHKTQRLRSLLTPWGIALLKRTQKAHEAQNARRIERLLFDRHRID